MDNTSTKMDKVKYWIVPSNNERFRLDELLQTHKSVFWRARNDFKVGDVVYIYATAPICCIIYEMKVVRINVSKPNYDDTIYRGPEYILEKKAPYKMVEFQFVRKFPKSKSLSYEELTKHGLKGSIQSNRTADGFLLEHIRQSIEGLTAKQEQSTGTANKDLIKFKHILEYFVAHLNYKQNKNDKLVAGYDEYIKPYVEAGTFKSSGQGWKLQNIQKQIAPWDIFGERRICINIYGSDYHNRGNYLNWKTTGANVCAMWNKDRVTALQLVWWKKETRWRATKTHYTIEELGLYDHLCPNDSLADFFKRYNDLYYEWKEYNTVDYEALENPDAIYEGAKKTIVVNSYERDRNAREMCIKAHGSRCSVCGLDFEKMYGEIGKGFIHVHHKIPIATIGKEYELDPVNDLVPVCPNCHAMLHRHGNQDVLSVEELRDMVNIQHS